MSTAQQSGSHELALHDGQVPSWKASISSWAGAAHCQRVVVTTKVVSKTGGQAGCAGSCEGRRGSRRPPGRSCHQAVALMPCPGGPGTNGRFFDVLSHRDSVCCSACGQDRQIQGQLCEASACPVFIASPKKTTCAAARHRSARPPWPWGCWNRRPVHGGYEAGVGGHAAPCRGTRP